ncbi:LemA family protein [Candidatus Uhrbacteria bacterium]|nr:LemA family protein [Candidatus Uhrbacteria bacterium]
MEIYIALALGIVILLALIGLFNSLVRRRNTVRNAWSDIDVQLKRRYDLIPNIVSVVKGYMQHERSVLEDVTKARTAALSAHTPLEKEQPEYALAGALKSLFAVAENYPDLKASVNFQQLQEQLSFLENDIQSARRYYNAAVREFNTAIQTFPSFLLAGSMGFSQEPFFQADEQERKNVNVTM